MRTIECAACERAFGCGVDTGACWCADVTLDAAARGRLAAAYEDCLCPDCLAAACEPAGGGIASWERTRAHPGPRAGPQAHLDPI
jgi:Cysteine-rich CWC